MKRALLLLLMVCLCLPLGGCAGLYAETREVEELLVIQTLGLDPAEEGVSLSLASGAGVRAAGSPSRLHGTAPSITAAIERIRSGANEEELFCSHISHVLLGEETARRGVEDLLDYICRSPELRISVPLYVVNGGTAEEAVLTVGDDSYGICDALDSVNGDVKLRGDGHIFSAADLAYGLAHNGSALVCAVECLPSAEKKLAVAGSEAAEAEPEGPRTVAAAGYAVLRDGKLCAFIDRDTAIGVGFLIGDVGPCELLVQDQAGRPVTLSLSRGSCEVTPRWSEEGALTGLAVSVTAFASVAERSGDAAYEDELAARLEAALSERIGTVLQLSRELGADFLGLGSKVELKAPGRFRALEQPFSALLPGLSLELSVSGQIGHTNDVQDG